MSRLAILERLALAESGVVVVTPTRRLARSIAGDFDAWQAARGASVWETPQVLPFAAFVAALYDRAQHDPALGGVRAPLAPAQEQALWESVIEAGPVALASTSGAAQLASEAWSLAHQWQIADRLRHYATTGDTRTFGTWAADYAQRVEGIGAIDPARLPDAVRALITDARLDVPTSVLLAGFDATTPQQQALFGALAARGTRVEAAAQGAARGRCTRIAALDVRDECRRMADWVADRLAANPSARIGVVIPGLAARRRSIERALDAALAPAALLDRPDRARPYTVSLGRSLAEAPAIDAALCALRVAAGTVDCDEASALLRSPSFALGTAAQRARFDLEWRRRAGRSVSLDHLVGVARTTLEGKDLPLHRGLEALLAWKQRLAGRRRRHAEWAALFADGLRMLGFPGADTPDSFEYQAISRWGELLKEFAALDRVRGHIDLAGAVRSLARMAAAVIFQPEGGDPPVQVLGVLEATGLHFDHLWLAGLTAEEWPPAARPHPLLPLELQRAKQMPGASADIALERARATLDALVRSSTEVVASHASRDGDRAVMPSPMIVGWSPASAVRAAPRAFDAIAPSRLEQVADAGAPGLPPGRHVVGGASILADHAACPFRAFARHRLDATEPAEPHDGLDAAERGELVHRLLARFWTSLPVPTRAAVAALSGEERNHSLARAADHALARTRQWRLDAVGEGLLRIEKERLVQLASNWLEYELQHRGDFEVEAIEDKRALAIGPLALRGRLDRVDRLPDGRKVIIDYKTGGKGGVKVWLGERPDEPQLPLYLVASETGARGIAFARLRAGTTAFVALAEDGSVLPGARVDWQADHADWDALVEAWRRELTRLADEFAAGRAEVAPKKADTCRYCDVALLCRVGERFGDAAELLLAGEPGGEDE